MISRRRLASAAVATAVAATVLAAPTTAWARYSATGAASLTVSADVLAPVTSVSFDTDCNGYGYGYGYGYGNGSGTVTVDWTASSDKYANVYTVTLSTYSGVATSTQVNGHNKTEATLTLPRSRTDYTVGVVAGYDQWTSTTASPRGTASC